MTPAHIGVVIPARDEEELLPRCLASVGAACLALEPQARVSLVVVLDSCADGSAAAAAGAALEQGLELHLLETTAGNVGAARAKGAAAALELGVEWIACTDADTAVPACWLQTQAGLASAGYAMVLGTVVPDARDLDADHLALWRARHILAEGHPHIHGANLGFSAEAYRAAGGFRPGTTGEDVDLARRIKAGGAPWIATDWIRALTSGRMTGRAPAGFSGYLRGLLN
ncbi:glycosyltransferase [Arthrobacter gandavensis]|uniref:glycosyltransferase n=1 Tax=Arthrobacter gandavensis TaxID=169960 RepID=UPI00188E958E|nr:glycosyltransferase [Arthrobacter gandavensis]MBF4994611.1 glycosyltransferase [Arthrobacter gandavensis]